MNKKSIILITGGAGFIGSNFILHYMKKRPDVKIINLDKLTYAGDSSNLSQVEHLNQYQFIQGDIVNEKQLHEIFTTYSITGVIHFAAESHVDRSIQDSRDFIQSNIVGTQNLLNIAHDTWEEEGTLHENRFHLISTDEVYGSIEGEEKFNEETPYDPRNPYSASKASANMLVKSFGYTYGMNVVISSSSNNYGPHQHEEKLVPTIISHALKGKQIPIYGDGRHVRDWLYVKDHCHAIELIFEHAKPLTTYTVGGSDERANIQIATMVCNVLDEQCPSLLDHYKMSSFKELITFTNDRKGHDRHYAINDSKLRRDFGWTPQMTLRHGLEKTVKWYINKWSITPA